MILNFLPDDLCVDLMTDWFSVKDLAKLDTSFCNKFNSSWYRAILKSPLFVLKRSSDYFNPRCFCVWPLINGISSDVLRNLLLKFPTIGEVIAHVLPHMVITYSNTNSGTKLCDVMHSDPSSDNYETYVEANYSDTQFQRILFAVPERNKLRLYLNFPPASLALVSQLYPNLKGLTVRAGSDVFSAPLTQLIQSLPELNSLILYRCYQLSGQVLVDILTKKRNTITKLRISECHDLSATHVCAILTANPQLVEFEYRSGYRGPIDENIVRQHIAAYGMNVTLLCRDELERCEETDECWDRDEKEDFESEMEPGYYRLLYEARVVQYESMVVNGNPMMERMKQGMIASLKEEFELNGRIV